MKEAVFCSDMMLELGFKEGFGSVPLYIDNTSALHLAGNRTYSRSAKHSTLRYSFVQELVEQGKIIIQSGKTQDQIADFGTKHANKPRHRALISSSSGSSRRTRQRDSVKRGKTRIYVGLEHFSILIGFGVFFSFSWTWHLHQHTVHRNSAFIFSRVKGLVVLSGIFLLFKFSV